MITGWCDEMMDFKGGQFEREIVLWGVRGYVAYPISYRQLEEMMKEGGVAVDHSSPNRWVTKLRQRDFALSEAGGRADRCCRHPRCSRVSWRRFAR